jgi:hypothetical protein
MGFGSVWGWSYRALVVIGVVLPIGGEDGAAVDRARLGKLSRSLA